MFITLRNFPIYSYRDKFLYGLLRPIWSSLKCLLILVSTAKYSQKTIPPQSLFCKVSACQKGGFGPFIIMTAFEFSQTSTTSCTCEKQDLCQALG